MSVWQETIMLVAETSGESAGLMGWVMDNPVVVLFALVIGLMLIGVPIAVAVGLASMVFLLTFSAEGSLTSIARTLFDAFPGHSTLLAIPFFILASTFMSTGGVAKRIIRFAVSAVGHLRGGLAIASVFACMLFAALSGSSPATVVAIGSICIAAMRQVGYTKDFAAGVICNAGTLGILIPPSIVMVVYAAATDVSVGRMFLGGVIPGLLAGLMLMIGIYIAARIRKLPAQPWAGWGEVAEAILGSAFGLLLIVIIMIGIYGVPGVTPAIFTPTEAAAVAAVYAFFVSIFIYRDMGPLKERPWLRGDETDRGQLGLRITTFVFIAVALYLLIGLIAQNQLIASLVATVPEGFDPELLVPLLEVVPPGVPEGALLQFQESDFAWRTRADAFASIEAMRAAGTVPAAYLDDVEAAATGLYVDYALLGAAAFAALACLAGWIYTHRPGWGLVVTWVYVLGLGILPGAWLLYENGLAMQAGMALEFGRWSVGDITPALLYEGTGADRVFAEGISWAGPARALAEALPTTSVIGWVMMLPIGGLLVLVVALPAVLLVYSLQASALRLREIAGRFWRSLGLGIKALVRGIWEIWAFIPAIFVNRDTKNALFEGGKVTIMLMFIIANALILKHVLTEEQIPQDLARLLEAANLGPVEFLIAVNLLLLVGGQFMEPSGLLIIVAPLVFPTAISLGIDPIHLGIMMVVNMEIGMITPPVGLNLFVTSGVAGMPMLRVVKAALPWLAILFVFLIIVTYVPAVSTWLPTKIMGPQPL